jgi:hypothetical protein
MARSSALLLSLLPSVALAASSVIRNNVPRVDSVTGQILDIHDGQTIRINDTFFMYGASYGGCQEMATGCATVEVGACGFNLNHTVSLATSTDLVTWTLVGSVLPLANRPQGIMFSPWVAQSKATGKYVLWFNVLPVVNGNGDFDAAFYAVAESESPYGPFVTVNPNVTGVAYTRLPDAPSIFVDDDGSGYIAFTHEDSHVNNVQQLTPDLRGPLPGGKVSAQIGGPNNEGILMFKREGIYYVAYGLCCCFCAEGSNVEILSSTSPLGPYVSQGNIATASDWSAQTGTIWFTGVDYVLYGDRWQSAPDHIKAHDFAYSIAIDFDASGVAQPIPPFQNSTTIRY